MFFQNRTKSIKVPEAKKMIAKRDVTVIDVRSKEDYESECIQGAHHADRESLNHILRHLRKTSNVICYCYKGISSKAYCKRMTKAGFTDVYSLQGGFGAWKKFHS